TREVRPVTHEECTLVRRVADGVICLAAAVPGAEGAAAFLPVQTEVARLMLSHGAQRSSSSSLWLFDDMPVGTATPAFASGCRSSVFRLVPPLSLKSAPVPSLCYGGEARNLVWSSSHNGGCGQDATQVLHVFDPATDKEQSVDPHALAKKLCDMGLDLGGTDDRPCEELISICLDVSRSMLDPFLVREVDAGDDDDDDEPAPKELSADELLAKLKEDPHYAFFAPRIAEGKLNAWEALCYAATGSAYLRVASKELRLRFIAEMAPAMAPEPVATPAAICPITQEPFVDPVITCDGHSYERAAIEDWFARGNCTSPATGAELATLALTPNFALRAHALAAAEPVATARIVYCSGTQDWRTLKLDKLVTPPPPPPKEKAGAPLQINLFLKTLNGKTVALHDVPVTTRIYELASHVDDPNVRFIFAGRMLEGYKTLRDYNVRNESTFHMVARSSPMESLMNTVVESSDCRRDVDRQIAAAPPLAPHERFILLQQPPGTKRLAQVASVAQLAPGCDTVVYRQHGRLATLWLDNKKR